MPESAVQQISADILKKTTKIHPAQTPLRQLCGAGLAVSSGILVLFLFGCAASGPDDNPITRGFTWYSYLSGDDIRNRCGPGSPDAMRFVYNGQWHEQVRTYEIRPGTGGRAGTVEARVLGQGDIASIDVQDVLRPWRGDRADSPITPPEFGQLSTALRQAGQFLRSDAYYWAASACLDGSFRFAAWQAGDQDLRRLPFPPILLKFDATGVPYREPRDVALGPFRRHDPMTNRDHWEVQIGEHGVRGTPRL
jgi:hypothetical protein